MKIAKIQKYQNFERKLKMSHGQNVVFGISGNLEKLVFPKNLPAVLNIRNQDALNFCNPNFLQNFAKFLKFPQNLFKTATIFLKKIKFFQHQIALPKLLDIFRALQQHQFQEGGRPSLSEVMAVFCLFCFRLQIFRSC